jgi:hypothetical protein
MAQLKINIRGKKVSELQDLLRQRGFKIDDPEELFGEDTRDAVRDIQRKNKLSVTGVVNAQTMAAINKTPPATDNPMPPGAKAMQTTSTTPTGYQVSGNILHPNGRAVSSVVVKAFDKGICEENPLGATKTDAQGRYLIKYNPKSFTAPTKTAADLVVRVYPNPRSKEPIASSPLIINARQQDIVNLSVGDEAYRGLSSYEEAHASLAKYLRSKDLACIEPQDVWLLADKTGLQPTIIAQYVKAHLISGKFVLANNRNIPAVVFFGLLRAGLSSEPGALAAQPDSILREALQRAVDQNWIPKTNIDTPIRLLRQARVKALFHAESDTAKLLKMGGVNPRQGQLFMELYLSNEKSPEEFWLSMRKTRGLTPAVVDRLQHTVELNTMTGGNLSLQEVLREKLRATQGRDLAKLNAADWKKLMALKRIHVPETISGDEEKDKRDNYANVLARSVESTYPTAVFANRWTKDAATRNAGIQQFFRRHPDFEFSDTSVSKFLKEKDPKNAERFKKVLAPLENLFHLAPSRNKFEAVKPLWLAGKRSAADISRMGKDAFLRNFSESLGDKKTAKEVYSKAAHITSRALIDFTKRSGQINGIDMKLLPTLKSETTTVISPMTTGEPDVPTLLREQTMVNCDHCSSALSPSAYLVDLLDFLERAVDGDRKNGRAYLGDHDKKGRPDIEKLELDCENSNTVMPYIDLVLEILENAVVEQTGFYPQTESSANELAAHPEYNNPKAYDELLNKKYPWNLPFNLKIEEARRYLSHLGIERHELLSRLHHKGDTNAEMLAATEYLGLIPEENIIVSSPAEGDPLALLWGFKGEKIENKLDLVENLLNHSGLEFGELEELFSTVFINPKQELLIDEKGKAKYLSEPRLDKLHRFVRLQRATGLSINELDTLLGSFSKQQIDSNNLIQNLADAIYIHRDSRIPIAEIIQWWSKDTTEGRTAFIRSLDMTEDVDLQMFGLAEHDSPANAKKAYNKFKAIEGSGFSIAELHHLLNGHSDEVDSAGYEAIRNKMKALRQSINQIADVADDEALPSDDSDASDDEALSLGAYQRRNLVLQTFSDLWELEIDQVEYLLDPDGDSISPLPLAEFLESIFLEGDEIPDSLVQGYALLKKQAAIIGRLEISRSDLKIFKENVNKFDWLDLDALPVEESDPEGELDKFLNLCETAQLNKHLFKREKSLFEFYEEFDLDEDSLADMPLNLAAATHWDEEDISFLIGAYQWNSITEFISNAGFSVLKDAFEIINHIGEIAEKVWGFTQPDQITQLKQSVKDKYDSDAWLQVSAELHNDLREKQRSTLLSCVIDQNEKLDNPLDVYAHYLIDPEMSSCYMTSRTKQANASIQQFIQRILLNLEPGLAFERDDIQEWEWRKNYRIWEANRKVFLYPENWIEPELRDDKSSFFQELEEGLLQEEVNEASVETAIMEYARKLHDVSNLEISGMYEDIDEDILYVIARTRELPHQYYLCQRIGNNWMAWKKIDVDIEGDHLIPVYYNRRLYLFWPIFTEKLEEKSEDFLDELANINNQISIIENEIRDLEEASRNPPENDTEGGTFITTTVTPGDINPKREELNDLRQEKKNFLNRHKYFEIGLAWSKLENGKWAAKKLSTTIIETRKSSNYFGEKEFINFKSGLSGNNSLHIRVYGYSKPHHILINTFAFDICREGIGSQYILDFSKIVGPVWSSAPHFMKSRLSQASFQLTKFRPINAEPLSLPIYELQIPLLDKVENHQKSSAIFPSQYIIPPINAPFFFEDDQRTFLVARIEGSGSAVGAPSGSEFYEAELYKDIDKWKAPSANVAGNFLNTEKVFHKKLDSNHVFSGGQLKQEIVFRDNSADKIEADVSAKGKGFGKFELMSENIAVEKLLDPNKFLPEGIQGVPNLNHGKYRFTGFYHPFACLFIKQLSRYGIDGLYNPDPKGGDPDSINLYRQITPYAFFDFKETYSPKTYVVKPDKESIDYTYGEPYSTYNWELFFHAPLLVASRLTLNQKFEEAQKWFHYIFDPTSNDDGGSERYWKFRPFFEEQQKIDLEDIADFTNMSVEDFVNFDEQVKEWEQNPFKPHAIARMRTIAYMRNTVMKYLDNLIAWGDVLFSRDTMESINEATQIYVLAAEILGPKPLIISSSKNSADSTLTAEELLQRINNGFYDFATGTAGYPRETFTPGPGMSLLNTLLTFCIPLNDKLLGYWDTVADRLFKIRHCQNIKGVIRQLPLYEPPIDPALLVQAAAGGLPLDGFPGDLKTPLPHYRFAFMNQKALEFLSEVKNLGSALLSALEKKDAEKLALLRNTHEVDMAKAVKQIKRLTIEEAKESLAGLNESLKSAQKKQGFYDDLIKQELIPEEKNEERQIKTANQILWVSQSLEQLATILYAIPEFRVGVTGASTSYGGLHFGQIAQAAARGGAVVAGQFSHQARMSQMKGGRKRRTQEWEQQRDLSEIEIAQVNKQIAAANIRLAMGEKDLENHDKQIAQSEETKYFLKDKFTNQKLYSWMAREISDLYFQAYQLAYNLAKRAERTYQYEFGIEEGETRFIEFGQWDNLKKGLLAGEKLGLGLKRMEAAYLDQNKRCFEITKNISLALTDPEALLNLRENGFCEFTFPELIFDMDYPGQYLRRIKSLSLTIPCITGPYTSVNCKLTLLKNKVWVSSKSKLEEPENFVEDFASKQSIVTSSGQNDSGLFQLNFNDERYLPFEGAGVDSSWEISMPKEDNQFDFNSLTDVIFQISYTAKESEDLKKDARDAVANGIKSFTSIMRLKNSFPDAWHRFQVQENTEHSIQFTLDKNQFPFIFQNKEIFVSDFVSDDEERPMVLQFHLKDPQTRDDVLASSPTVTATSPNGSSFEGEEIVAMENGDTLTTTIALSSSQDLGDWSFTINGMDPTSLQDISLLLNMNLNEE